MENKSVDREKLKVRIIQVWVSAVVMMLFPLWMTIFGPIVAVPVSVTAMLIGGGIVIATRCQKCGNIILGATGGLLVPPFWIPKKCPHCGNAFH
jgi:hypothetical protein